MVSPLVICNGVIRSGSTWSYNVCRLLAELLAKRRGESSHGGYLNALDLEKSLQAEVYFRQGPAVFKAHGTGPLISEWIRTGKAKAVCTLRDLRDCVASDVAFMNTGFDSSVQRVVNSLNRDFPYDTTPTNVAGHFA